MGGLIRYAIEHKAVMYFICFLLLFGGIVSYKFLGQLEDPVFTVKSAVILTRYPGAAPGEVEQEVTDRIEKALQELPQVDKIYSLSSAGESYIKVDIKQQYWADVLPQIWDELRKKVVDIEGQLPPGAKKPMVMDDYGAVYGFLMALTGEGFTYRELEEYAEKIKNDLALVEGVSRVELWGLQQKVIYVDVNEEQYSQLKLSNETGLSTLANQNMVVDAGSLDIGSERFRIAPSGAFASPEEIGELIIRPSSSDIIQNVIEANNDAPDDYNAISRKIDEASKNVIRVKDFAVVHEGYLEPPLTIMRYNGAPSIAIQVAGLDEANIVTVGDRVYEELERILEELPVGIELHKIAWQSTLVSEAVNGFIISLLESIAIVLIVLVIPSGLRMGLIIGIDLFLTILGTFIVMALLEIPLQRMSLGALIIALGMMVDNSIVVSDGIAVRLRQGVGRKEAAIDATKGPAFPLFAATIVAVMAFFPIFAARSDAGEYCRTLFIVVATSLIISWFIAIMITPLQCMDMLSEAKPSGEKGGGEYDSPFYRQFRNLLKLLIRHRFLSALSMIALLLSSVYSFNYVSKLFFPDSSRPQLMLDFWAPVGTRIESLSEELKSVEKKIIDDASVESVTTFIGAGPPRFFLPLSPEKNYPYYAEMIVNFDRFESIDPFIERYEAWLKEELPFAMVRPRKFSVGPSDNWKFEYRISGPRNTSLQQLREIGNSALDIVQKSPIGKSWRTDMLNRTQKIVPEYDQKRGRWSSVSRSDLAAAAKRGYDGNMTGLYRERDHLIPIILRNSEEERKNYIANIELQQIRPDFSIESVPLLQVVRGVGIEWEDPVIPRWNRKRSVTLQGEPVAGVTFRELKASLGKELEEMPLPSGFTTMWDGEEDSTKSAQQALIPGVVPAIVIILLLLVMVFNAFRPVAVICMTIPFAMIGVTYSLLFFNIPFGFLALLGAMSLAGMMNKNIVVLLDACNDNIKEGMVPYHAIIEASVTRLRPVLLAAGTTVLGVIPLLPDVFWVAMAVTIMGGLAFGSILTLLLVPVFYSIVYKIEEPELEATHG